MKAEDGVLRGAVRRLQWNAAVRERRAHVHNDTPITGQHAFQRRERAVHVSEIRDLGDTPEFFARHLFHGREDRRHGVVDPDVDRSERALDVVGRAFDGRSIGDVQWEHQRPATARFDVLTRGLQAVASARDQSDCRATLGESLGDCSPEAGRRAGNDDDFPTLRFSHALPRSNCRACAVIPSAARDLECQC